MRLDVVDAHRLERAVADVQRDRRRVRRRRASSAASSAASKCRPAVGAAIDPRCARIHRLIPLAIRGRVGTMNVGRQRDVADRVDRVGDRSGLGLEADPPAAEEQPLEHLHRAAMPAAALEDDAARPASASTGMHQRLPLTSRPRRASAPDVGARLRTVGDTRRRRRTRNAMTKQASREHTCVVRDQQIAAVEGMAEARRYSSGSSLLAAAIDETSESRLVRERPPFWAMSSSGSSKSNASTFTRYLHDDLHRISAIDDRRSAPPRR